jgi:hypothetical protein
VLSIFVQPAIHSGLDTVGFRGLVGSFVCNYNLPFGGGWR